MRKARLILTSKAVNAATKRAPWALGDDVLYDMCRAYPHHKDPESIWTKVVFIGRVYAAAIERRKKHLGVSNDVFYSKHVIPAIRKSKIDLWIARAANQTPGTPAALRVAVDVHAKVTALFKSITGLSKRSLAAKYLHFHAPAHFFIYDSLAVAAMRRYGFKSRALAATPRGDPEYEKFVAQCAELVLHCKAKFGVTLTPRHVDYLLLDVASL